MSSSAFRSITLTISIPTVMSERSRTRLGVRTPAGVWGDRAASASASVRARTSQAISMPAASSAHPSQGSRTTKKAGAARQISSAGINPTESVGRMPRTVDACAGMCSVCQRMGDLVLRHPCCGDGDQAEDERKDAAAMKIVWIGTTSARGPATAIDSGMRASETKKSRLEMRPSMCRGTRRCSRVPQITLP